MKGSKRSRQSFHSLRSKKRDCPQRNQNTLKILQKDMTIEDMENTPRICAALEGQEVDHHHCSILQCDFFTSLTPKSISW